MKLCILAKTNFPKGEVEILEKWIDGYYSQLPKLRNFILPVRILVFSTYFASLAGFFLCVFIGQE